MAVNIRMPKWGLTMKEGKLSKWFKKEGDKVEKGEELFEVETEKITNTVESVASGMLFQIVVSEGTTVPVGAIVAIIADLGEQPARIEGIQIGEIVDLAAPSKKKQIPAEPKKSKEKEFVLATPRARWLAKELGVDLGMVSGTGPGGKVTGADVKKFHKEGPSRPKITPLAEEMASQEGLDITTIEGTGEDGRITKEDVERALRVKIQAAEEVESVAAKSILYSGMRKAIGDNMMASLRNTAQLSAFAEVDVTDMVEFRDLIREKHKDDKSMRISYNDIIILAVSRALKKHPIMNSTLVDDEILLHDSVNMGMAVAVPEGLIVPVLRDADKKGLLQIAREARDLAEKARTGTLNIEEVTGGTFTITNTSMYEMDGFTPILRPPETGILGVGRVRKKPAEYKGEIALRWVTVLSLTYDHRVVDGAPAHAFLETVGRYLQHTMLIMV